MHNLEVILVLTSPCPGNPAETRFLLLRRADGQLQLPLQSIECDQSSLECAASLLMSLTGIEARVLGVGWLELVQCPLVDNVDRKRLVSDSYDGEDRSFERRWIAVPYGAMLPGELVKPLVSSACWLTFTEVVQAQPLFHDHLEILTAVANTI